MSQENLDLQLEEVGSLSAIYGEDWRVESENMYSMSIKSENGNESMRLQITLPPGYPLSSPPTYQLSAPNLSWFRGNIRRELCSRLEDVYLKYAGECIIFMWIELLRDYVQDMCENNSPNLDESEEVLERLSPKIPEDNCECPKIMHGKVITDRKSSFQGHVAAVKSESEVRIVLNELYQNKKIAGATHNIYSYRIWNEAKGVWLQDCEDDGEAHAGGRLLHLLQMTGACNVLAVVTRWYGGILLGPDRFKHINNAARITLQSNGFINESTKKKSNR